MDQAELEALANQVLDEYESAPSGASPSEYAQCLYELAIRQGENYVAFSLPLSERIGRWIRTVWASDDSSLVVPLAGIVANLSMKEFIPYLERRAAEVKDPDAQRFVRQAIHDLNRL